MILFKEEKNYRVEPAEQFNSLIPNYIYVITENLRHAESRQVNVTTEITVD